MYGPRAKGKRYGDGRRYYDGEGVYYTGMDRFESRVEYEMHRNSGTRRRWVCVILMG